MNHPSLKEQIHFVDSVIIYEKYVERPDGIYYLWRLQGEDEWHEKLTAHKETPYVSFKVMPKKEYELRLIEKLNPSLDRRNKTNE